MARAGLVDFERVRAQADFAAILTAHGIAVPRGRVQIKVLCPFHDETKPSLSINLAQGVFHCFGCGASGSVIDFVLRTGACDGPVAASRRIAEICGFDLPMKAGNGSERPLRGARRPQERRRGSETTEDGSEPDDGSVEPSGGSREPVAGNPPLTFALKLDPEHPYRLERGAWLTPGIVDEFGLGFCSRGMMQGCYCGPITDENGQVVAYFGRRICPAEEIPEGQGKYVLPPREKFDRSLELYNLHRAIKRGGDRVLIVEGFFGAIRAFVALDVPVVATMGNAISDAQIGLIERHFARATLLYDGGENGRQAAGRAALRLCRARIPTDIADLPDGEQPDTVEATVLGELLARPD